MPETPLLKATAPPMPLNDGATRIYVMLDLETWGTGKNAAIASIGAAQFTLSGGVMRGGVEDPFYRRVDLDSCLDAGLATDDECMTWWITKNAKALNELLQEECHPLKKVLEQFLLWLPDSKVCVFANGPSFDSVILAKAMEVVGLKPIECWRERCVRTKKESLADAAGLSAREAKSLLRERFGEVGHHAALDAIRQAEELSFLHGLEMPTLRVG